MLRTTRVPHSPHGHASTDTVIVGDFPISQYCTHIRARTKYTTELQDTSSAEYLSPSPMLSTEAVAVLYEYCTRTGPGPVR